MGLIKPCNIPDFGVYNLESFFNINRKDEYTPVVEQQPHGRRRKDVANKINHFFKERLVPAFQFSKKEVNMPDWDIKLYAEAQKNSEVRQQIINLKELAFEIKQIKQHLIDKIKKI